MSDNIEEKRAELIRLIKNFDWYYDRSEDFSYWSSQNAQRLHIENLAKSIPGGIALLQAERLKTAI